MRTWAGLGLLVIAAGCGGGPEAPADPGPFIGSCDSYLDGGDCIDARADAPHPLAIRQHLCVGTSVWSTDTCNTTGTLGGCYLAWRYASGQLEEINWIWSSPRIRTQNDVRALCTMRGAGYLAPGTWFAPLPGMMAAR